MCGAPNARAGLKGVFAPVGSYVPGINLTLTKAKIRGVESNGMMLSERELELSDEHSGIIELAEDTKVGTPAAKALGLDDVVFDIAITPNRPDCLGVRGVARDLAAAGLGRLKPDPIKPVKGSFANPIPIKLDFDKGSADACPIFAGRVVRGVKNGPSPEWLQRRLKAIGLRPINALVDITNYIAYDRGRPLHVYDADKITGAIRARLGKKGETFKGLDGKSYDVDEDMCVIADDSGVLGLGGVLGGEDTGSTEETTNVFIESAYFAPKRTARTGRRLNIQSDARYRFERGVDPAFVVPGLELATRLVLDMCGGTPSKVTIAGKAPKPNPPFAFDPRLVGRLSGLDLKSGDIKRLLTALGVELSGTAPKLKAAPPSWRPDIFAPVDLAEEVVRLVGVDAVPATPLPRLGGVARPVLTEAQWRATSGAARAGGARAGRGRDLVVHSARGGQAVRRRRSGPHLEQSDLDRSCGDAAEPAAWPHRRRQTKPRPRLCRRRLVRARPCLSRAKARGSICGGLRRPLRAVVAARQRPRLVWQRAGGRCVRGEGRRGGDAL